jgi:hypothetical protein
MHLQHAKCNSCCNRLQLLFCSAHEGTRDGKDAALQILSFPVPHSHSHSSMTCLDHAKKEAVQVVQKISQSRLGLFLSTCLIWSLDVWKHGPPPWMVTDLGDAGYVLRSLPPSRCYYTHVITTYRDRFLHLTDLQSDSRYKMGC